MKAILSSILLLLVALAVSCDDLCPTGNEIVDLATIQALLDEWNATNTDLSNKQNEAEWDWATNITDANAEAKSAIAAAAAVVAKEIWSKAVCVNCTAAQCSPLAARRVEQYTNIGTSALNNDSFAEFTTIQTAMENVYATAKVCRPNGGPCVPLDPDLTAVMANSNDYCELSWAWEGWRNESGRKMRQNYGDYVYFMNEAGRANGYSDPTAATSMWTSADADDEPTYFAQIEQAWKDVKPLYQELHAYVKNAFKTKRFPGIPMPASGHMPAHLTGNMWAQDWTSIYPWVVPNKDAPDVNLDALLTNGNYTYLEMFELSDEFFKSLGMDPMTDDFWFKSVFIKPKNGVEMVCHASAWDFSKQTDFRIKMCTVVTSHDFQTVHHEMGHIQYFMHYKGQPIEFRTGANPGFHEAVGDLIALSVMTPEHLKTVNLLPDDFKPTEETYLNSMMQMALKKIAFLPFGYLIDKYRWDVFDGKTPLEKLNVDWWAYRCREQGVSPPVERDDVLDFDAGSKYHVPASVPYIRYFFSYIVQFQFHEAMCREMGVTKDLHKCDIFGGQKGGKILSDMLALGKSVPYPKVLKDFTGYDGINASALINYFQPLMVWLKAENAKSGVRVGWDDQCSKPAYDCNAPLEPTTSEPITSNPPVTNTNEPPTTTADAAKMKFHSGTTLLSLLALVLILAFTL